MSEVRDVPTRDEQLLGVRAVHRALARGELVRPDTCAWCGSDERIEAHHPDYARPLMVVWICHACHRNHHREYYDDHRLRRIGI